jgi:hypothetical protein
VLTTSNELLICSDSLATDSATVSEDSTLWGRLDETTIDYPILVKDGELGTPLPFSIHNDNLFSATLFVCLVLFIVQLSRSTYVLTQQAKNFFQASYKESAELPSAYPTFHLLMVPINSILLAIAAYIYATEGITRDFVIESHYLVVAIFFGCFLTYFLVKWLAYSLVNSVFFGSKKRLQWNHAFLFITSIDGTLMFPLVFLLVYFNWSIEKAVIFFAAVLFLNKTLSFYKSWSIFFRQKGRFLQIFLYFCALEAMPLLAIAGVWLAIVNLLKVNF